MGKKLLPYHEAPTISRAPFILSGYRPCMKCREAMVSSFSIHNETFNIWSHLFGSVVFSVLFCFTRKTYLQVFSLQQVVFYLCSSFFHMMCCCEDLFYQSLAIDNIGMVSTIGICVGIATYICSCAYATYWLLGVFCVFMLGTSFFIVRDVFSKRDTIHGVVSHCCIGITFSFWLVPSTVSFILHLDVSRPFLLFFIEYILWTVTFSCFVLRYPERLWPGRFDFFGCSHNIFHVLILLSSMYHFYVVDRLL